MELKVTILEYVKLLLWNTRFEISSEYCFQELLFRKFFIFLILKYLYHIFGIPFLKFTKRTLPDKTTMRN